MFYDTIVDMVKAHFQECTVHKEFLDSKLHLKDKRHAAITNSLPTIVLPHASLIPHIPRALGFLEISLKNLKKSTLRNIIRNVYGGQGVACTEKERVL